MKQLLIVNSGQALKSSGSANDLTALNAGQIGIFTLSNNTFISAAPTGDFGIALGKGSSLPAFVIPEVDISTLRVTETAPKAQVNFSAAFTMPTTVVGKEYTVILIKKGTVPGERNMWSTTYVAKTTTAATEAAGLVAAINNKVNDMFPVTASNSSAAITISSTACDWECKLADELYGVSVTITNFEKAIGDKAYIEDLAQRCAGDKGFTLLYGEGKEIYPGYPEAVEDFGANVASQGYAIFNLHFATGRKYGKQVDELVWQDVHIAVPKKSGSAYTALHTVLAAKDFDERAVTEPSAG